MKKLLIQITLLVLIISCDKGNYTKEFYKNGNLKLKIKIDDNKIPNGSFEEFFQTGELKSKGRYFNGKINDTVFTFYKNGIIKEKGVFREDSRINWWCFYDSLGFLEKKEEYKLFNDSIYKNQTIFYTKDGSIINDKSSFFILELPDTLFLGKNVGRISQYNTDFKADLNLISIIIENKYSESEIKKDTFSDGTLTPLFGVFASKTGKHKVRGIILEEAFNEKKIRKDSIALNIIKHKKYFEKEVYIKEISSKISPDHTKEY